MEEKLIKRLRLLFERFEKRRRASKDRDLRLCLSFLEFEKELDDLIFGSVASEGKMSVTEFKVWLETLNAAQTVCGHVFASGEIVYSCRSCASDPTCVMCHKCFKESAHMNHDFVFHTSSGGGGCCDCGDEEAWKQDHACAKHSANSEDQENKSLEKLPPGFEGHAEKILFGLITCILKDLYTTVDPETIASDEYAVLLYNDEFHTFDEVIMVLTQIIGVSSAVAREMANAVDQQGRVYIARGSKDHCKAVLAGLLKIDLDGRLMTSMNAFFQEQSLHAVRYLKGLSRQYDPFRRLLARVLYMKAEVGMPASLSVGQDRPTPVLNIEFFLVLTHILWEQAGTAVHDMLVSALLLEKDYKDQLAESFLKFYQEIHHPFYEDGGEKNVIGSMSVQLFTCPSISVHLVRDKSAFAFILKTLARRLQDFANADGVLVFPGQEHEPNRLTKALAQTFHTIWSDLGYFLRCNVGSLSSCFEIYLSMLEPLDGMVAVVRQGQVHVEFEQDALHLAFKLYRPTETLLFLKSCTETVEEYLANAGKCVQLLFCRAKNLPFALVDGVPVLHRNLLKEPFSLHCPLARLLAGLLARGAKFQVNLADLIDQTPVPDSFALSLHGDAISQRSRKVLALVHSCLYSFVAYAQLRAGLWVRNGQLFNVQFVFHRHSGLRQELFDRDIIAIQLAAAVMDPEHFMSSVIHAFGLQTWPHSIDKEVYPPGVLSVLLEELLMLLIYTFCERYDDGVGTVGPETRLRRHVVHTLAVNALDFGSILRQLVVEEEKDVALCLKDIAKQQKSADRIVYTLNPSAYQLFSPYYCHFSLTNKTQAESQVKEAEKVHGAFVEAPLPPFSDMFAPAKRFISSKGLLQLVHTIFKAAFDDELVKSGVVNEAIVRAALYLVLRGLEEEYTSKADPVLTEAFVLYVGEDGTSMLDIVQRLASSPLATLRNNFIFARYLENTIALLRKVQGSPPVTAALVKFGFHATSSSIPRGVPDENQPVVLSDQKGAPSSDQTQPKVNLSAKEAAARRREKILSDFKSRQEAFMEKNKTVFSPDEVASPEKETVALDDGKESSEVEDESLSQICQICHESTGSGPLFAMGSITQSTYQCENVAARREYLRPLPPSLYLALASSSHSSTTSICGHMVHRQCFSQYLTNKRAFEIICPICKRCVTLLFPCVSPKVKPLFDFFNEPFSHYVLSGITLARSMVKILDSRASLSKQDFDAKVSSLFLAPYFGLSDLVAVEEVQNLIFIVLTSTCGEKGTDLALEPVPRAIPFLDSVYGFTEKLDFEWSNPHLGSFVHAARILKNSFHVSQSTILSFWSRLSPGFVQNSFATLIQLLLPMVREEFSDSSIDFQEFSILTVDPSLSVFKFLLLTQIFPDEGDGFSQASFLQPLCVLGSVISVLRTALSPFPPDSLLPGLIPNDSDLEFVHLILDAARAAYPRFVCEESTEVLCVKAVVSFLRTMVVVVRAMSDLPMNVSVGAHIYDLCEQIFVSPAALVASLTQEHHLYSLRPLVHMWLSPFFREGEKAPLVHARPVVRPLISLPEKLINLVMQAAEKRCPKTGNPMSQPCICLLCGEFFCMQSPCCQVDISPNAHHGACFEHAKSCGKGVGLFFNIKQSRTLVMYERLGYVYPSLYVGEHGEQGDVAQGRNLMLNNEMFDPLKRLWVTQEIIQSVYQNCANWRHISWTSI